MSDRRRRRRLLPHRKVAFLVTLPERDYRALVRSGLILNPSWGDRPAEEVAAWVVAHLAVLLETAHRRPGSWEWGAFQRAGMVDE